MIAILAAAAMQTQSLSLPPIFADGMVLQRQWRAPVWGKTKPSTTVTVRCQQVQASAMSDSDGLFRVNLAALKPSRNEELVIRAGNEMRTYKNVMIGDVWICSGQSNMEWPLAATENGEEAIAEAKNSDIRLFQVPNVADTNFTGDVKADWKECTPESIRNFSAVGYYFGQSVNKSEKVPIGLIDATWGGTLAEAWSPPRTFDEPALSHIWENFSNYVNLLENSPERKKWAPYLKDGKVEDWGNKGEEQGWHRSADPDGWNAVQLPANFTKLNLPIDGAVWFRRTVIVTQDQAAKGATLHLGTIDDMDTTYVNGVKVGETNLATAQAPHQVPRSYKVAAGTLKAGENLIAVRVFDSLVEGGFSGQPEMSLEIEGQKTALTGDWQMKVEMGVPAVLVGTPPQNNPNSPTALWQGMVKPIVPYGIAGVIWYQGESNAQRADEYAILFPAMIQAWRREWGFEFPFLWVQLANFMARKEEPAESDWAKLRESQTSTLSLPKTGMAVIIDIGDAADIHPRNKKDVGERLAMSARTFVYRNPVNAGNSPRMTSVEFTENIAKVNWVNGEGLKTKDGQAPIGFAVKVGDKWSWATSAKIDKGQIIVEAAGPIQAVRYAWADNPDVNLVNGLGLPACPFQASL